MNCFRQAWTMATFLEQQDEIVSLAIQANDVKINEDNGHIEQIFWSPKSQS